MPKKRVTKQPLSQESTMPAIEKSIFVIRGQRVIFDSDLAELYGVTTGNLNKAVKRNLDRFPSDFMFQLDVEEFENLRFQIGISKKGRGGRRYMPHVYTEHGAIMVANVLRSERAALMSVYVVRAFVKLRELVTNNKRLAEKIAEIEERLDEHDDTMKELLDAVRFLLDNPAPPEPKRRIGFASDPSASAKSNRSKKLRYR